jgi:hypothetical protein
MECEKIFLTHIKEEEEVELPKIVKVKGEAVQKMRIVDGSNPAGRVSAQRPRSLHVPHMVTKVRALQTPTHYVRADGTLLCSPLELS